MREVDTNTEWRHRRKPCKWPCPTTSAYMYMNGWLLLNPCGLNSQMETALLYFYVTLRVNCCQISG